MPERLGTKRIYGLEFKLNTRSPIRQSYNALGVQNGKEIRVLVPLPKDKQHNNWAIYIPADEYCEIFTGDEAEDHAFFRAEALSKQQSPRK